MSRDVDLYLGDIQESCRKIQVYTDGLTRAGFEEDEKTVEAVAWNLVVIGEAVKQLPEDRTKLQPEIEWRKVAGLRDVLVHSYFGLDHDIVWDVARNKVPALEEAVEDLRAEPGEEG